MRRGAPRVRWTEVQPPRPGLPVVLAAQVQKRRVDGRGQAFLATEALRIVEEPDGHHVDFAGRVTGAWLPWEPIPGPRAYRGVRTAKRAAAEYAAAGPEGA